MNKELFLEERKNYEVIYGFMYGKPILCSNETYDMRIIDIPISKLKVHEDGLLYIWGYPGPDCNFYDFKDYGVFLGI